MNTLANVLDPHGAVFPLRTALIRPWTCLYRRRRTRQVLYFGRGGFLALALIIGAIALALRLAVLILGTELWLAWSATVLVLWLLANVASYVGPVLWRTAAAIGNDA